MVTDDRRMTRRQGREEEGKGVKEKKGARGEQEEEREELSRSERKWGRVDGTAITGTFHPPRPCKVLDSHYLIESSLKPNAGGNIISPISQMWRPSSQRWHHQPKTCR